MKPFSHLSYLAVLCLPLILSSCDTLNHGFEKRRYTQGFFSEHLRHKQERKAHKEGSQENHTITTFAEDKCAPGGSANSAAPEKNITTTLNEHTKQSLHKDSIWGDLTLGESLLLLAFIICSFGVALLFGMWFPAISFALAITLGALVCLGLLIGIVLLTT